MYHVITTTDQAGRYTLPDVSQYVDTDGGFRLITNYTLSTQLAFFKPGFIEARNLRELNEPGEVGGLVGELQVESRFPRLKIKDALMIEVGVPPEKFSKMVGQITGMLRIAECGETKQDRERVANLKMQFQNAVAPLPCRLPMLQKVNEEVAREFGRFQSDEYFRRMRILGEPNSFPWRDTTAGALCAAISDSPCTYEACPILTK